MALLQDLQSAEVLDQHNFEMTVAEALTRLYCRTYKLQKFSAEHNTKLTVAAAITTNDCRTGEVRKR